MRHQDPGSVCQAKTTRAPAEGACHHRGEGAEPDAIARDCIEGRLSRGHSKEFRHRCSRKQCDGEVNGRGVGFPEPADQFLEETPWWYGLRKLVQARPFLFCLFRFSWGRGEGADEGHQAACLLLADLSTYGRHVLPLAVEDTLEESRTGPPCLPGDIGEVGDFGKAVARLVSCAVRPMAFHAALPEKLTKSGRSGCQGGRLPRGRTLGKPGRIDLHVGSCPHREVLLLEETPWRFSLLRFGRGRPFLSLLP